MLSPSIVETERAIQSRLDRRAGSVICRISSAISTRVKRRGHAYYRINSIRRLPSVTFSTFKPLSLMIIGGQRADRRPAGIGRNAASDRYCDRARIRKPRARASRKVRREYIAGAAARVPRMGERPTRRGFVVAVTYNRYVHGLTRLFTMAFAAARSPQSVQRERSGTGWAGRANASLPWFTSPARSAMAMSASLINDRFDQRG